MHNRKTLNWQHTQEGWKISNEKDFIMSKSFALSKGNTIGRQIKKTSRFAEKGTITQVFGNYSYLIKDQKVAG
jgi:hypothetical protein